MYVCVCTSACVRVCKWLIYCNDGLIKHKILRSSILCVNILQFLVLCAICFGLCACVCVVYWRNDSLTDKFHVLFLFVNISEYCAICICFGVSARARVSGREGVRKVICLCLCLLSIIVYVWRPHFPSGIKNFLTWPDLIWLDFVIAKTALPAAYSVFGHSQRIETTGLSH